MEFVKTNSKLVVTALTAIIVAFILGAAYKYKFKQTETIVVTGMAEKEFVSDLVVWSGDYNKTSMDVKEAYALLKKDESTIRTYLQSKGVEEKEIVFSAINTNKLIDSKYDAEGRIIGSVFNGYSLSQTVSVSSKDINKVEKISREATELIESGIEFNSSAPQYFYSKLSELKIDLLAKASADAKTRAQTIAENAGGGLGSLRKAAMGVFQITGQNTDEDYSYGGVFNTTSINKKATITIKTEYAVD